MSDKGSSSGGSRGAVKAEEVILGGEKNAQSHYVDTYWENGAHVLDVHQLQAGDAGVKTASDGVMVLIPQPSSDPNDPLNWSPIKKHIILTVISIVAFMPDFGSSMVALATAAWCAAATSFESYMAARILNGFFSIVAQAGGLMFIQDIFFFHEHPRKINIWSGAIIVSPYLGPLITAFIINKLKWPVAFWVFTAFTALCWLLVVGFMDETIYNRNIPRERQPVPKSRLLRLVGVEQWRSRRTRQSFGQAIMRPIIAISKLPVLLCTIYYFLNFAWIIGVNATISIWLTSIYKFTPYNLGMFYFAPTIGSLLGAGVGHWLHDLVGKLYMKRHNGVITPEARLLIIWLASPLMAVSILVLGFALEHTWHYMAIAVFCAIQVAGIMIATVALNAYLLDAYPEGSGEVGAWIVVGRTLGGFMATYIEINWVTKSGLVNAFGAQTGITAAAGLIIVFLGLFGQKIRQKQGRMTFAM
ncbi:MAG: hypothetical protein Q9201_001266 [Fulgogasparrea decipioides]